ncbi:MAG: hypothetical protein ACRDP6_47055 [Actinoallomurus sp.]
MAVRLKKSTVRGWVNDRKALPDSGQFSAMSDFFVASRAVENGDAERLREVWEDACRHKDELRYSRKASPEEAERTEPSAETGEPPSVGKREGAAPITLQVHAHANANANAQADGGSRTRRMITWISVGVALGAALPSLAVAFGTPYFTAAKSTPQAAPRTVSVPASPPPAGRPSKEPKTPAPKRAAEPRLAGPPGLPVPARTSTRPKPIAAPVHSWWCTYVVVARAGVYSQPRTDSALIKYKTHGDGIRVEQTTGTPAGWYVVRTSDLGTYWMQSAALGTLKPSTGTCFPK